MTWCVGMSFFLGYGLIISDIRVTWAGTGQEADCLQKVYPVGPFIAASFAGSVFAGLVMVENLQRALRGLERDHAWVPRYVAQQWRRKARFIYRRLLQACPGVDGQGCDLLLAGPSPDQDVGIPGLARCWVWRMRAPDFEPEFAEHNVPISIGSGAEVEHYKKALANLGKENSFGGMLQSEVGNPGGFGRMFFLTLTRKVEDYPITGISRHLHLCVVKRGEITIEPNDQDILLHDGGRLEVRMPPVARSWAEFQRLSEASGVDAVAATCQR